MSNSVDNNNLLATLDELYAYAKSIINSKNITPAVMIDLMNRLIQIVEKYKNLTGQQKKMLVVDTLNKIINENVNDDMDKQNLMLLINAVLPHVIDSVVSAINGDMKFIKDIHKKCFSKCC